METELELMNRLRQGDEHALAELYKRLGPHVHALALRMLGSREEAEEVLQDTFLRLYKNAASYRADYGSVRAYTYTIARNEVLSRLRKRRARPLKADDLEPGDFAAPPPETEATTRVVLEQALASLEPLDVRLLQDAFFQGYSHAELSERLGLPLGTIKSRLRRALLRLRPQLEDS